MLIGSLAIAMPSHAGTIAKTACTKLGSKKVSAGKLYTCVKVGKKKQWNTGSTCPKLKSTLTIDTLHYKCVLSNHKKTWVSYVPIPKPSTSRLTNNKKRRSVQMALRMPVDLAEAMDALCASGDLRRSDLIVAALRKHLNKPDPASLGGRTA